MNNSYIAGLFDGEGYVGVTSWQKGRSYMLRCTISNNDLPLLEMVQKECGGKINAKSNTDLKQSNQFHLVWHSENTKIFLRSILPYLISKKEQVELALTFPINPHGKPRSEEMIQKHKMIYDKLKSLKFKKYSIPDKYIGIADQEHQEMLKKKEMSIKFSKEDGLSTRQIGKKIGVSHVMVARYLKV